jgi:hypothetical protein
MRAVTRMQLRMTAPTADGLELEDKALQGDEEYFDLGEGERGTKSSKMDLGDALHDAGLSGDEDETEEARGPEEEVVYEDSEDEREAKTKKLEGELDGMYDDYRDRMQSRDHKFKVKEARMKDKSRESWKGITEPKSDEEGSDDEEEGEEGGYENRDKNRAMIGEEKDSSDEDTDDEVEGEAMDEDAEEDNFRKAAVTGQKRTRGGKPLLTKFGEKEEISTAAKVWFDQPVFKGLEEFDELDEDVEDEEEEEGDDVASGSEEEEEEEETDEGEVYSLTRSDWRVESMRLLIACSFRFPLPRRSVLSPPFLSNFPHLASSSLLDGCVTPNLRFPSVCPHPSPSRFIILPPTTSSSRSLSVAFLSTRCPPTKPNRTMGSKSSLPIETTTRLVSGTSTTRTLTRRRGSEFKVRLIFHLVPYKLPSPRTGLGAGKADCVAFPP